MPRVQEPNTKKLGTTENNMFAIKECTDIKARPSIKSNKVRPSFKQNKVLVRVDIQGVPLKSDC